MNLVVIDRTGQRKLWTNIDDYYISTSLVNIYEDNKRVASYVINNLIGWYEIKDIEVAAERFLINLQK